MREIRRTRARCRAAIAGMIAAIVLPASQMAIGAGQGSSTQPATASDAEVSAPSGAVIRDCEVCPELIVVPAGDLSDG